MRAVRIHRFGDPMEVLEQDQVEAPSPRADEALVRMTARPINPTDRYTCRGRYPLDWVKAKSLPATPGMEGVGVVERVGSEVTGLSAGQRVVFFYELAGRSGLGTWAEYTVGKGSMLVPIPDTIDDDHGAQFFINPLSAAAMLSKLSLPPGSWVVVTAAGSGVGLVLLQLAAQLGLQTVATCRRPEQRQELLSFGASRVVHAEGAEAGPAILEATGGVRPRGALDAVGGALLEAIATVLEPGSLALTYGNLSGQGASPAEGTIRTEGFWLSAWIEEEPGERYRRAVADLVDRFAKGQIRLPVDSRFDLADARQAVLSSTQAGRGGKVLLIG